MSPDARTPVWRKSSYSVDGSQCVELAGDGIAVLLRDSKHPENGHIVTTRGQIAHLIAAVTAGQFDHLLS